MYIARGGGPAANLDNVLMRLGGIDAIVGKDDVVLLKVSAQWWNQGMTNVAAVRRMIEKVLSRTGFAGEVIVFENVHFRGRDGSSLVRAWTHPSERNVDVDGWTKMGDLILHFAGKDVPISFVGLADAGESLLKDDDWHDPHHEHGVYGGDGSGPIAPGEERDGYHWDFEQAFELKRSLVDSARCPLTWPVFTSKFGTVVDLKEGVFRRENGRRATVPRKLTWICMTTANEHSATGFTGAVKSTMGVVDMSAGQMGTHPLARGYQAVHYFGFPDAMWRMAGPLAHFARMVRTPDLYVTVAEWVGAVPDGKGERVADPRLDAAGAYQARTIVAGKDPVAIDAWCARNLLMPLRGAGFSRNYNMDNPNCQLAKFLRYYRQIYGSGTLDPNAISTIA